VLLMIFEKPSLRTRLSFETGMVQLGGHAIHFDMSTLPLGSGKESVHDTVKVAGRYVDLIMARLYEHSMLEEMASNSDIPVINALTNRAHPCQVLADLLTIQEVRGKLGGVVLAYIGDSENNMTYSLMAGAAKMGINMRIGCPDNPRFLPRQDVLEYYRGVAGEQGGRIEVHHDPEDAVRDADVVYTDSWMSYHVAQEELAQRVIGLMPYQVTNHLMECARPDAIFMNCLPALRGYEQTAEVIDGPRSVVFDQAENRLHSQKAVMIRLLG
jgi:ornithine carbamoyltransferase